MRVAVIHNLKRGGAWRRLREQLRHMNVDVLEVVPATATPVTDAPVVVAYSPSGSFAARWRRPLLRHQDLFELVTAWRGVARAVDAWKPQVVFANPCQFLQAPWAIARVCAPVLYFCDEPRRADYDQRQSRNRWTRIPYWPLHQAERRLDRAAVTAARRVVTNSRYTSQYIGRAYGVHADVLPLGVAETFLVEERLERGDCVLSVGALVASKGHELVIRAAGLSAHQPRVVIVAPRGDADEARRLERVAREAGVGLEIETAISDAALRRRYATARVVLYLARDEPLGLVSLEAQACGTPVIVAADGGLPETVRPNETGFVVERDPAWAAAALNRLADPHLHQRMSDAARAHGRSWSWARSGALVQRALAETSQQTITPGRKRRGSGEPPRPTSAAR